MTAFFVNMDAYSAVVSAIDVEHNAKLLWNLPREIWHSRIFRQLSLQDICHFDSALLNKSMRPSLRNLLQDAEVELEAIVFRELVDWVVLKGIKPLRVKLIDATEEHLYLLIDHCPQLQSLNTWYFEDDAQEVLRKRLPPNVDEAACDTCSLDERDLTSLLESCQQLKCLRLCCDMEDAELWDTFTNIVHLIKHLDEVCCRETEDPGDEIDQKYSSFCLTHRSFRLTAIDTVPVQLLSTVAAHYTALTSVSLYCPVLSTDGVTMDAGVQELAKNCPGLVKAVLRLPITGATLLEFCRLRFDLMELQIVRLSDFATASDCVHKAVQLLPGLQIFCCYLQERSVTGDAMFRAVADAQLSLQALGVTAPVSLCTPCWGYVLQKCTKLRTVITGPRLGTTKLRSLAKQYNVQVHVQQEEDIGTFCVQD